jgi:2-polyprenyl-3-methyl-5-hydroxy-6-metoxy-1,4-benzoquinol methylase
MSDIRVVPGFTPVENVAKHINRYSFALCFCQNKTVLDAACGSGYGTRILAMVAKSVLGIDIDKDVIYQAETTYNAPNSAYLPLDLELLNKSKLDQQFDVIVSLETLEHLENPTKVLKSFAKLLNPGGMLVASVPLNEVKGQNEHHKHIYTLETAKELFKDFTPITELVQHGLSLYPTEFCSQFPDDPVYYLFAGISQ